MKLTVNGEAKETRAVTLADLVSELGLNPGRIASEVNGEIVRRADYAARKLKDGDVLEIVQMIGGG